MRDVSSPGSSLSLWLVRFLLLRLLRPLLPHLTLTSVSLAKKAHKLFASSLFYWENQPKKQPTKPNQQNPIKKTNQKNQPKKTNQKNPTKKNQPKKTNPKKSKKDCLTTEVTNIKVDEGLAVANPFHGRASL